LIVSTGLQIDGSLHFSVRHSRYSFLVFGDCGPTIAAAAVGVVCFAVGLNVGTFVAAAVLLMAAQVFFLEDGRGWSYLVA
jgi:hypothetical protein